MPKFTFLDRVVMSPETFEALPIVAARPEAVRRGACRALIMRDGRTKWHTVERQISFGQSIYFASPIVVRVYAEEAA